MRYSKAQIEKACEVNLIDFMLQEHKERITFKNSQYRDTEHDSLVFYDDHYHRYSNGEHGNIINYMHRYLKYSFPGAVKTLLGFVSITDRKASLASHRTFYKPIESTRRGQIAGYLEDRGLSIETINRAFEDGVLYSAMVKNEGMAYACFANDREGYYILRNTQEDGTQKMIISKYYGGFWYWSPCETKNSLMVYVCEAPIDALSLYELKREQAIYTAMGGLKDIALRQITDSFPESEIVIAVDSDTAGDDFYMRHSEHERIVPSGKDWNENLMTTKLPSQMPDLTENGIN